MSLAGFLRRQREAILRSWAEQVRTLPSGGRQDRSTIRDHVPLLLDELADAVDGTAGGERVLDEVAAKHAKHRFEVGYDVRDVVTEYGILRRSILARYQVEETASSPGLRSQLSAIIVLDAMLDEAIREAVDQFVAERDRANEILTAVLSHDLRAPLQSILIGAEWMVESEPPVDPALLARTATRIRGAVERMNRMITSLLDFTRARLGGGLSISPADIDLRALIADTVAEVGAAYPDRRIENHTQASQVDLRGTFGPVRTAQAITNLLVNAIQHGREPITLDAVPDGDAVRIEVCNGGEIPREIVPDLFRPFAGVTTRSESSRRSGGLGLGLYIVSEIARAHRGRVDVVSEHGTTCFRLWLPRNR